MPQTSSFQGAITTLPSLAWRERAKMWYYLLFCLPSKRYSVKFNLISLGYTFYFYLRELISYLRA
jgi:hypothetical protein